MQPGNVLHTSPEACGPHVPLVGAIPFLWKVLPLRPKSQLVHRSSALGQGSISWEVGSVYTGK